jgi:hypothetical protein
VLLKMENDGCQTNPNRGCGFQPGVAGEQRRLPRESASKFIQPQTGCVQAVTVFSHGRNTFGVGIRHTQNPRVGSAKLRQPWAEMRKPVGLVKNEDGIPQIHHFKL